MTPFETSCMPSLKRVGMLYGKNNGTPLCQEFHYEPISTWIKRTKSLLLMWWLLTWCEKQCLQMSLVDQHVQLQNLVPFASSLSIEGFMRGTTLFQWPWRCMVHLGVIWIILSRSVSIFSTIDDQEVIYPCFFAFNFSNILILHSSML